MEARRTFEAGAKSSKQIWIVVAALLVVLALGVAGAYFAKSLTSASAPASGHVVKIAFTQSDNAQERSAQRQHANTGPVLIDRNAGASSGGATREPITGRTGPLVP